MHRHPPRAQLWLSLWAPMQPGAWWEKRISLGPFECLCYPLSSLTLLRENEGIWGKAFLRHRTVVKLQIRMPLQKFMRWERIPVAHAADQPAGLKAS